MNLYEIFQQHPVITTDSRDCPDNSIFFALRGETFDGNQYAVKALQSGCAYAVVDDENIYTDADEKDRLILVPDVLKALQALANEHRKTLGTTIIGVTGTNGKTTTKELIAAVLSKKFNVLYTQGNFNNHIGVPKTLLGLTRQHDIAVVEMGANHPGEIRTLVNIVEPDFGIITNVGKAHLLGFGSFEGVIRTKGELYDFIREHGGKVFINEGNEHLMGISQGLELIRYGNNGRLVSSDPFLRLEYNGREVSTNLIGAYNRDNCLAAAAIGHFFGVSDDDIRMALSEYTPTNNRSQFKQTERNSLIIDAYNANPTSMTAALDNFRQMKADHKMCILGAMRELGEVSKEEHRKILGLVSQAGIEEAYFVGPEFQEVQPEAPAHFMFFEDIEALKTFLATNPPAGKTILVKGSNSTRLIQAVELL